MHMYTYIIYIFCMFIPEMFIFNACGSQAIYIHLIQFFIVYTERGCDCLKSCIIYISGKLYAAIENCLILIYIFVYLCYNAHFTE